ncbi:MAG: PID-CTERM protein-sorting domain-containing protein [Janthinobacterium lividum]
MSVPALAQAPGSTGPTITPNATAVPLDGGATLLLASGVALGFKKLRERKKKRS